VKWPESGRVKTRLGKSIGMEKAAGVYRQMVLATARLARSQQGVEQVFCFSPAHREADFHRWFVDEAFSDHDFRWVAQVEGDLGERQSAAAREAFERGAEQVVLIGSDCLALTPRHLELAWAGLSASSMSGPQAVMGPAEDGGYYLLGLSHWEDGLLSGVPWSSTNTAERCQENLYRAGYSLVNLEVLKDIDTYDDFCCEYPDTSNPL
ncbi:MAG: TIGR04282 family arsenosugar biosynthesis glycosyltransferase, partial [Verrucomicrobiota bacterium]